MAQRVWRPTGAGIPVFAPPGAQRARAAEIGAIVSNGAGVTVPRRSWPASTDPPLPVRHPPVRLSARFRRQAATTGYPQHVGLVCSRTPVYGAPAGPRRRRHGRWGISCPLSDGLRRRGARGNPVRFRDCPAAVFGNDRRQRHWVQPAPGKRRPVGPRWTRPTGPAHRLGPGRDARESEDLPAPGRDRGRTVEPRGTAGRRTSGERATGVHDPGAPTAPAGVTRPRCGCPMPHPSRGAPVDRCLHPSRHAREERA